MTSLTRWWKVASVVLTVGVLLTGARFTAQAGQTVDALQRADEPNPKESTPAKTDLKPEFVRRYALAPGQDLKRIAPPFNESRIEYYNTLFPGRRTTFTTRDLKILIFKQRDSGLIHPAATFGGGDRYGTDLTSLLTQLAGIYPQELEGKQDLLQTFVEGDFVAREGVPTERLIHLLEKILREECKLPLTLTLREVERNVVVARGRYKFRPVEPGRKSIEIYGQTLVGDGTGGGGSGDFEEMLRWVGRFTEPNSRIVNEAEEAPKGPLTWHLNSRSVFTKETRQEDHDIALVFEHLADQTGLTFKHEDRKVRVLSVARTIIALSRQPRFILNDHKDVAWCAAFAPDGKSMVTCSGNRDATAGEVRGYDLATGKPVSTFLAEESHGIRWVAFAPDGATLATAEYDGMVRIRDAATGKVRTKLDAHHGGVQCLKFTRDGMNVVTCGKDGTAKAWSLAAMKATATMAGHDDHVYSLDLSPDNKTVVTGCNDSTAALWDVATGRLLGTIPGHTRPIEVVRFSPDGQTLATGGWDGIVKIWDTATEKEIRVLGGPGGGILALAFSPSGQYVLAGTDQGRLKLWDATNWSALDTIAAHEANLRAIAFSPNGKLFATASFDRTVKVWDAP